MGALDFSVAVCAAQSSPAVMLKIVIIQRRLITGATCLAVTFVQRFCVVAALRTVELFIAHVDTPVFGVRRNQRPWFWWKPWQNSADFLAAAASIRVL